MILREIVMKISLNEPLLKYDHDVVFINRKYIL